MVGRGSEEMFHCGSQWSPTRAGKSSLAVGRKIWRLCISIRIFIFIYKTL